MHEYYSIRELTHEFGITTRTLRYYEDEGLISPYRRGRTRLYTQADRNRIEQILRAKRLNFSLSDIAELIQIYNDPVGDQKSVQQTLEKITEKRHALRQMRHDLDDSLHELERIEEMCYERLAELGVSR